MTRPRIVETESGTTAEPTVTAYDAMMHRMAKEALADTEAKTPREYAGKLKDQAAQGNTPAQSILAFLGSGVTYENIIEKVQSCKHCDQLRPYIETLEQKKDYMVAMINAVSGTASEGRTSPA